MIEERFNSLELLASRKGRLVFADNKIRLRHKSKVPTLVVDMGVVLVEAQHKLAVAHNSVGTPVGRK